MSEFGLFSKEYLKFRPLYPLQLYNWISSISDNHHLALDVGTGNGQAAHELIKFFDHVVAIDSSIDQLMVAVRHAGINYACMPAENICLTNYSTDLIVSASAAHWFNLEKFYLECQRILKPQGKIVIWTYTWPEAEDSTINKQLMLLKKIVLPYFSQSALLHVNKYEDLFFPFSSIASPNFKFEVKWNLEQLAQFFMTWISIRKYNMETNKNFIQHLKDRLSKYCQKCEKIKFVFPLYLKAGVKS